MFLRLSIASHNVSYSNAADNTVIQGTYWLKSGPIDTNIITKSNGYISSIINQSKNLNQWINILIKIFSIEIVYPSNPLNWASN